MKKYHRVWIAHNGPIPKDNDGRSMEIHHIDGNSRNNDITNLQLVTINEHYNIHRQQGDLAACQLILLRMKLPPDTISQIVQERLSNGTHNFLDETFRKNTSKRHAKTIANGTHNLLGSNNPVHIKISNGTHHWLGGAQNQKRINEKTHNLLGSAPNTKRLSEGTHPSQILVSCVCCRTTASKPMFTRWHKDCKSNEN